MIMITITKKKLSAIAAANLIVLTDDLSEIVVNWGSSIIDLISRVI